MRARIYLTLVLLLLFTVTASADTVVLKSGTEIDGKIVEETNEFIRIDAYGTEMLFLADEIESVNGKEFSSPVVQDYDELIQEVGGAIQSVGEDADSAALMEQAKESVEEAVAVLQETTASLQEVMPEDVREMIPPETAEMIMAQEDDVFVPPTPTSSVTNIPFGDEEKAAAAFMGIFGILMVLSVIFYVYMAICLMTIAQKTGAEPAWLAWIPIGNIFLMCNIAGVSYWWAGGILLAGIVPWIGGLASLGMSVFIWWKIAEARNKPGWMALLMLVPIANVIIMGVLAFSDSSAAPEPINEQTIPVAPPVEQAPPTSSVPPESPAPPPPQTPEGGAPGTEQGPKTNEQGEPPKDIPPAPSF